MACSHVAIVVSQQVDVVSDQIAIEITRRINNRVTVAELNSRDSVDERSLMPVIALVNPKKLKLITEPMSFHQ